MTDIGAYDAKTHLSELLDRVENGERITITRYGRPVAELVPAGDSPAVTAAEAIERIRETRKGRSLDGLSVVEMIREGRRL